MALINLLSILPQVHYAEYRLTKLNYRSGHADHRHYNWVIRTRLFTNVTTAFSASIVGIVYEPGNKCRTLTREALRLGIGHLREDGTFHFLSAIQAVCARFRYNLEGVPFIYETDKRVDNAKCVIEIDQTVPGSIVDDRATGVQVARAAWELIQKCTNSQGRGGMVHIGKALRNSFSDIQ